MILKILSNPPLLVLYYIQLKNSVVCTVNLYLLTITLSEFYD